MGYFPPGEFSFLKRPLHTRSSDEDLTHFFLGHFCPHFLSGFFSLIGSEPGEIIRAPPGSENQTTKDVIPEGKGF